VAADCLAEIERCIPGALESVTNQLALHAHSSESALVLYILACPDSSCMSVALEALASPISKYAKQFLLTRVLQKEPMTFNLLKFHLEELLLVNSPTLTHLILPSLTQAQIDLHSARLAKDLSLSDSLRILALRWRAEKMLNPQLSLPQPFDSLDVKVNAAHAGLATLVPPSPLRASPHILMLFDFVQDFFLEAHPGPKTAAIFGLFIHALALPDALYIVDRIGEVLVSTLLRGCVFFFCSLLVFIWFAD